MVIMRKDGPRYRFILASLIQGCNVESKTGRWSDRDPKYNNKTDPLRLMPWTIAATWEYWQPPHRFWESMEALANGKWSL